MLSSSISLRVINSHISSKEKEMRRNIISLQFHESKQTWDISNAKENLIAMGLIF